MNRIVGIDYGSKRTGIAVSDPLGIFATAIATIPSADVIDYIKNYTLNENVVKLVVGYPMNLNNRPSEAAKYVNRFLSLLGKHLPEIPVILEDERFTSKIAFRTMIDGGVKKMARRDKSMVDKISAAIILQSYLDRVANNKNR